MLSRARLVVAIAVAIAGPAVAADALPGASFKNKAAGVSRLAVRQQLPSLRADLPSAFPQRLATLSVEEFPAGVAEGQALAGVHRRTPERFLDAGAWHPLPGGGRVWRVALESPGAAGIRLHFEDFHAGSGRVWIHDGSRNAAEIMGAYTGDGPWQDGEFWSDYVMSDTVVLEYEPAGDADQIPFRIAEISHLLPDAAVRQLAGAAGKPDFRNAAAAVLNRNQSAASCNLDVSCYSAWAEAARAVGHMVYEKDGSSFVCTGTLVNTRGSSFVPYFLTAAHCVSANAVARTLQTFWGYQTRSCNGQPVVRREANRVLGATYLAGAGVSSGDFSLLRLTEAPPEAYFVGWNPAELPDGSDVTAIHHPSGDFKRISFGLSAPSSQPAFYRVNIRQGVVQPGSSGSPVFSSGGQLRGVLSSGPKLEDSEYCSAGTLPTNYGRFPIIYNALRDYFEDRADTRPANPTTPPPSASPTALTSGTSQTFTLDALTRPTLVYGNLGYSIRVPEGATRLEIRLVTETPGADVDLYARFGTDVALSGSQVQADHRADGPSGNETLTITSASTPALRAGTYYIALGVFSTGMRIAGRVTATVSTSSGNTETPLTSGVAQEFSIGPVTINTLFDRSVYRIVVPEGATGLDIELQTTTQGADVDLYAAFNTPVALQNSRVVADHKSEGETGNERISITRESNPPLRAGTYYIALGLFTHNVRVAGTIRATVRTPPPSGRTRLTSGRPQSFRFDPVDRGTLFYGDYSMVVEVPANARRLVVQVNTATPDADLDLYVRHGSDTDLRDGDVVADHRSEGPTGTETITITPGSTPALRAGLYYISLAVFTTGKAVAGTVTATVDTGSSAPTPSAGVQLTSGQASRFNLPPESQPFLHNGDRSFSIEVPAGATRLTVELRTTVPSVDVDLFVRHGSDVDLSEEGVVSDFQSETESGSETIVISSGSNPPLKPGTYYISLAVFTTDVGAAGMLTATVERGFAPSSAPPAARPIDIGTPGRFELPSVDGHTLFTGDYGYYFDLPSGSGKLEVVMKTETAEADVDLYLRYGAEPEVVNGRIIADHRGFGETGEETLAVDSRSVPPLRPGRYYVGLGLYTPNVAATGEVIVRYESPSGQSVEQTLSMQLPAPVSGKGRMGKATRIPGSAKYDFGPLSKKQYGEANRR